MVGRNIAQHHRAFGHQVVAPGRETLDLSDANAVADFVAQGRFDIVIHVAGRVGGIGDNMVHPVDYLVTNFDVGRNVLLAARTERVPRLLNLSSSCIYPKDRLDPLSEGMILTGPLEPTNEGYALAKIAVLRLCAYIAQEEPACRYKTAIPCNIFGAYDKFDAGRAHLVPAAIAKVFDARERGSDTVEIWGDGLSRREFMFAEDLADFVWEAVERFEELPDLINVGLGTDYDINTYFAEVATVLGWDGDFVHDLTKPSGMRRKLVDITRLRQFGWEPTFTLKEGIQRTYDYYRKSERVFGVT